MKDEGFPFDERPFDALLGAVDFDGFAVLAGDIKEGAIDEAGEIAVLELDVAGFDGEGGVVAVVHLLADGAGGEAGNVFGFVPTKTKKWSDAMSGVVHGGEAGPVSGPSVHVLLMGGLEELEFPEFPFVIELLHEEEFTGVNHRFHHHVFEAGRLGQLYDGFTILDGGCHGDGAGNVFTRFEGRNRLLGVIWDGRVDMDCVDVRISEEVLVALVAFFDAVFIPDFIQSRLGTLTNCREFSPGMALVDGDEFGSKTEADNCDANRLI